MSDEPEQTEFSERSGAALAQRLARNYNDDSVGSQGSLRNHADVRAALQSGASSLDLPKPLPQFAPPARRVRTVVGIDTWFWIPSWQWRPVVRVVTQGAVTVTLTANPVALQLLPGDGQRKVTCSGPGQPWRMPHSRSLCSHRYQRASTALASGRYRGTVRTLWMVRWISSTGLGGVFGPVSASTSVSLRVAEVQAVVSR